MDESKTAEVKKETARLIYQNISELILYTRKTESEILDLLKNAMTNRNKEWEIYSKESVLSFHRNSEHNIYCLVKWNSEEKYQEIRNYIAFLCKDKDRVLDFGGGTGELSIFLDGNGVNVEFLEVPGKTLEFTKWRFKRRHIEIPVFTSLNQIKHSYDVIIAIDVMDVLEKPLAHLKKFHQLLNKNGLLIFSFGETGSIYHPMHLSKNIEFVKNIEKYCQETGFRNFISINQNLIIKQKI